MDEPYEHLGKFGIILGIIGAFIAGWFWGFGVGILILVLVILGMEFYPLFMDSARWRANCFITISGLGTFSALSLDPLNQTADDPETRSPGKLLFAFGGGGPRWGMAWRDGGKAYAAGGYIEVPNDCPIIIGPNHLWLPVVPMRLQGKENMVPHFQATVEENGCNPQYTSYYSAQLSLISLIPASEKVLDTHALIEAKNTLIADHRELTADFTGHHATQIDLWKQVREVVEPKKRTSILRQEKQEKEQEDTGGD